MVARKSSKKIASVVADMIEADVLAMLEKKDLAWPTHLMVPTINVIGTASVPP